MIGVSMTATVTGNSTGVNASVKKGGLALADRLKQHDHREGIDCPACAR